MKGLNCSVLFSQFNSIQFNSKTLLSIKHDIKWTFSFRHTCPSQRTHWVHQSFPGAEGKDWCRIGFLGPLGKVISNEDESRCDWVIKNTLIVRIRLISILSSTDRACSSETQHQSVESISGTAMRTYHYTTPSSVSQRSHFLFNNAIFCFCLLR